MRRSSVLRSRDLRSIFQIAAECRELGDDRHAWRSHLLLSLGQLVNADLGVVGEMRGCRDLQLQDLGLTLWQRPGLFDPRVIHEALMEFQADPARTPVMLDYFRRSPVALGDCLSRRDVLDDRSWYASDDFGVVFDPCGLDQILWCFRPIPLASADDSSGIVLARAKGQRPFAPGERALVREMNAAITPMIGGPVSRYADPSPLDLAPRVRDVLACLLEGDGDKQIAARLSMSPHTVNQYTKAVYRHFGCQGRAQLLARWLRRYARFPTLTTPAGSTFSSSPP